MKRIKVYSLLFAGISLLFIIAFFVFSFSSYTLQTFPISVHVGNKIGFDVNTTALHFGTLKPGFTAERILELRSNTKKQLFLTVDGIDFVFVDEPTYFLSPNETLRIRVIAAPPLDTPYGDYVGTLFIRSKPLPEEER